MAHLTFGYRRDQRVLKRVDDLEHMGPSVWRDPQSGIEMGRLDMVDGCPSDFEVSSRDRLVMVVRIRTARALRSFFVPLHGTQMVVAEEEDLAVASPEKTMVETVTESSYHAKDPGLADSIPKVSKWILPEVQ